MKYIASCSFGKDSLAMVLMLIERGLPLDEVVFYDTGMEFQAIYDLRDDMLPIFQQHGIKYTTLYPDNPFLYDMLERPVKGRERRGYDKVFVHYLVVQGCQDEDVMATVRDRQDTHEAVMSALKARIKRVKESAK